MKWRVVQQGNGLYGENRLDFTFHCSEPTKSQLSLTQMCFENAAVTVENCAVSFN